MSSPKQDCPFCERITDEDRRFPWASFEPLTPVTPGHLLFVPTEHIEHPDSVALGTVMWAAEGHAAIAGEDYNLITSFGPAASMTVPHMHIHYVPRRPGDGLKLPWSPS